MATAKKTAPAKKAAATKTTTKKAMPSESTAEVSAEQVTEKPAPVKRASKATGGAQTTLSTSAPWPFPTYSKP